MENENVSKTIKEFQKRIEELTGAPCTTLPDMSILQKSHQSLTSNDQLTDTQPQYSLDQMSANTWMKLNQNTKLEPKRQLIPIKPKARSAPATPTTLPVKKRVKPDNPFIHINATPLPLAIRMKPPLDLSEVSGHPLPDIVLSQPVAAMPINIAPKPPVVAPIEPSSASVPIKVKQTIVPTTAKPKKQKPPPKDTTRKRKLTSAQEQSLLKSIQETSTTDPILKQLSRKLHLIQRKRQLNIPLFCIDTRMSRIRSCTLLNPDPKLDLLVKTPSGTHYLSLPNKTITETLSKLSSVVDLQETPIENTFLGKSMQERNQTSLYSGKILPKHLLIDYQTITPMQKLLQQISTKFIPIEYGFLNEYDVEQCNLMLKDEFWEVDVSEWTMMPEYTVIARLGKRVIGCCLVTPDGYISYLNVLHCFQRFGIGRFLLWFSIKKSMSSGVDLRLHVQADNKAVLLYQSFGFKVERFIRGYYEKYIQSGRKGCLNALYLRLRLR